jgi:hypothetical protein
MHPVWFFIAFLAVALLLGIARAVQGRKPHQPEDLEPQPTSKRDPHWNEQVAKFNESLRRRPNPQDRDGSTSD